jgi:hypothetical protein
MVASAKGANPSKLKVVARIAAYQQTQTTMPFTK